MTVATTCFKWADLLESQFDKSWIELDHMLSALEDDEDFSIIYDKSRRNAASLASCFSQLSHKASVVFQNNAKLEAELIHLREETASNRATIEQLNREKAYLSKSLQSSLAKNHKLTHPEEEITEGNEEADISTVPNLTSLPAAPPVRDSELCSRLIAENERLRTDVIELESEMVGARLDNVYLDKELAGRIQQIQLLLASNTSGDVKEKMWTQIESEMCLQRSKTIAQMCRTKQEVKAKLQATTTNNELETKSVSVMRNGSARHNDSGVQDTDPGSEELEEGHERRGKQVNVYKNNVDDLGMAILGGKDHNLPIIISEIFPNSALSRCNRIKAGDIICSVNDEDFSTKTHSEAVNFLSSLRGQILFDLKCSEDVSEDDPSNLDYRFYKLFHPLMSGPASEAGPGSGTASPHPGKAVSVERPEQARPALSELPAIHASPAKGQIQIV